MLIPNDTHLLLHYVCTYSYNSENNMFALKHNGDTYCRKMSIVGSSLITLYKHALISMFISRYSIDVKRKNMPIGDLNSYTYNFIILLYL